MLPATLWKDAYHGKNREKTQKKTTRVLLIFADKKCISWCTWGSMTLSAWKVNVNIFIGFRSLKCHIILVGHFYGTGQLKSLRMITFPPSISATATHFWGYGIFRSFHIPTWWFPWGRYVVVGLVSWGVDVLGTSRFQASRATSLELQGTCYLV